MEYELKVMYWSFAYIYAHARTWVRTSIGLAGAIDCNEDRMNMCGTVTSAAEFTGLWLRRTSDVNLRLFMDFDFIQINSFPVSINGREFAVRLPWAGR